MTNLTNFTELSDIYEVIKLYDEMNSENNKCWSSPVFWMMLVMLATQYLKPVAKHYYKQRQQSKDKNNRRSTSTLTTSDA